MRNAVTCEQQRLEPLVVARLDDGGPVEGGHPGVLQPPGDADGVPVGQVADHGERGRAAGAARHDLGQILHQQRPGRQPLGPQRPEEQLLLGPQHRHREQDLLGGRHSPQSSSTSGARSSRAPAADFSTTSCSWPQAVHSVISPFPSRPGPRIRCRTPSTSVRRWRWSFPRTPSLIQYETDMPELMNRQAEFTGRRMDIEGTSIRPDGSPSTAFFANPHTPARRLTTRHPRSSGRVPQKRRAHAT